MQRVFLVSLCFMVVATHVFGQADPRRSLQPLSFSQQPIGEPAGGDNYLSTFVRLSWEPPLFEGQPELFEFDATALQGGCELAGGAIGERTTISMQFADEEGDVGGGRPRVLSRPSLYGAAASLIEGTFTATAATSGSLSFDVCIDFDSDTDIVLELSVTDAAGNPSRFISLPVSNPILGSAATSVPASHRSWSVEPDAEHLGADHTSATYGQELGHLIDGEIPYAQVVIDHSYVGDLVVRVGVGDPANPDWVVTAHNREGGSDDDLVLEVDLSGAAAFLPPSSSNGWFLEVSDEFFLTDGEVIDFTIITQASGDPVPQVFSAGSLPQPVISNSSTTIIVEDSDHNTRTALVEINYELEEFSWGVPPVSVEVGTATDERFYVPVDWKIERVISRPAGRGSMKLYLDVSEALVRPNKQQTWFLKANSSGFNGISGVVNTFTILTRNEAYVTSDLPQPFEPGDTPHITLIIPFDGPLVPAAFVLLEGCPDSLRLGVADPRNPDWEAALPRFSDCTYELDLSDAAAFLPPSVDQPWFVEVSDAFEGEVLRAFSIRMDDRAYYAPGLPVVLASGETTLVSISRRQPPPELLGYRLLRGSDFTQTEVVADSIPPYSTHYLDLLWRESSGGDTYWILALYGYFDALGYPEEPFFLLEDGNKLFSNADVKTKKQAVGAIWGDFDNDGDPDLFVPRSQFLPNFLFKNTQGHLQKIPWSGDTERGNTQGAAWGDYNNDDFLDLVVANTCKLFDPNCDQLSRLYKNNKDGTFSTVNTGAIETDHRRSRNVSWGDFDNDGDLDLFIANLGERNTLLRNEWNQGEDRFTIMTAGEVGDWINDADDSWGGFWADYDNDGDLDLFVINVIDAEPNKLYGNQLAQTGEHKFEPVEDGDFTADEGRSISASWGDMDNDGDLDLFVANEYSPKNPDSKNWLYENHLVPSGTATLRHPRIIGVVETDAGRSNASAWGDLDNDGDLDLYTALEGEKNTRRPRIYLNDGTGTFVIPSRGNTSDYDSGLMGAAWADVDQDGFSDLFVADLNEKLCSDRVTVGCSANFVNNSSAGTSNRWLSIHLQGTESNRTAIGASVTVVARQEGNTVRQRRQVTSLSGAGGQNSPILTFGVGTATSVDSILVAWPSGLRSQLSDVSELNRRLTIKEDLAVWPGDTNNDDEVNEADVLPIQQHFGLSGPARPEATLTWQVQAALPWNPLAATHADANGDGFVNQADVLPIGLNWRRTPSTQQATGPRVVSLQRGKVARQGGLRIVLTDLPANPGEDFKMEIRAEDVTNLFGVAFELHYAPLANLVPLEVSIGEWVGDDLVYIDNIDAETGVIAVGVSRKAGQGGLDGSGVVAQITMRMQAAVGVQTGLSLESVMANDPDGIAIVLNVDEVTIATDVETQELPDVFALSSNFPNPFNPTTTFSYALPVTVDMTLTVYDLLGREMQEIVSGPQPPGTYEVSFDATGLPSGVYFYRLEAGDYVETKRMVVVK